MRHLWLLLVFAGCSSTPERSMVAALPARAQLHVAVPAHRDAGTTAVLYEVTRQTSKQMNGAVDSVLDLIADISAHPATAASGDAAEWGPFTPPLSPATYRLIVERVAPDATRYHLDARPRGESDDSAFRPLVAGEAGDAAGARGGRFTVDQSLAHQLDPLANPGTGAVQATYHLDAATAVRMQVGDGNVAAVYRYDQLPDGSGDFRFATHANLAGDPATLEDGLVRSRWLPSGAGRGDAHVRGGDAGAAMDLSECWDASFARTFVTNGSTSDGDPASCAFPDAAFADL
ncbi:MAG: uncharacterized protein JWN44_4193 [Myxococcales bacterium]|nr:uncharacterized protein [Myxococcales bacterium]